MNYSPNNYLYEAIAYLDGHIVQAGIVVILCLYVFALTAVFHIYKGITR